MTAVLLYQHPDGLGEIEFDGRRLIASTEAAETTTSIAIGPDGLRTLARKLSALADVIDGGAK